jgi:hypothetical protein
MNERRFFGVQLGHSYGYLDILRCGEVLAVGPPSIVRKRKRVAKRIYQIVNARKYPAWLDLDMAKCSCLLPDFFCTCCKGLA